jgi:hypothetical protein
LNFGKFLGGSDKSSTSTRQIWSLVLFGWTNTALLPDISGEARQIWSKAGYVHRTFSGAMFDDRFDRNLLIIFLIALILLLLVS